MGGNGSCYLSKQVKAETAALGFRVKSGWAAVVLLTGPTVSPKLCDSRAIDLCDPRFADTRQPYHAAMGKLETDTRKINRRTSVVQRITKQSIIKLLEEYQRKGYAITRASLIVGSQVDPASIANPHVRAHALEGRLFRSVLKQALNAQSIRTVILLERDAYDKATTQLKKSSGDVRRAIQNFGRFTHGPWRADQKLAALAAWVVL